MLRERVRRKRRSAYVRVTLSGGVAGESLFAWRSRFWRRLLLAVLLVGLSIVCVISGARGFVLAVAREYHATLVGLLVVMVILHLALKLGYRRRYGRSALVAEHIGWAVGNAVWEESLAQADARRRRSDS